jgi:hypothetical protein
MVKLGTKKQTFSGSTLDIFSADPEPPNRTEIRDRIQAKKHCLNVVFRVSNLSAPLVLLHAVSQFGLLFLNASLEEVELDELSLPRVELLHRLHNIRLDVAADKTDAAMKLIVCSARWRERSFSNPDPSSLAGAVPLIFTYCKINESYIYSKKTALKFFIFT